MEFFIKKIFDGKTDEDIHLQFQKFSRGEYKDRAMIKAKNSKGKYTIGTTTEYVNEVVKALAEKHTSDNLDVKGVVVSTSDLTGQLDFHDKKQFMGVKQYKIEKEMTGQEIVEICNKFPKCFFALSFKTGDTDLKIKAKAPKSSKPSSKGDKKPKADFLKLKTTDKSIVDALIFDSSDFKEAEIEHTFLITDIKLPQNETDPLKIRENAIRKGKIIRKSTIDGQEKTTEVEFTA